MKTYFEFRKQLAEALGIYTNPNAFEPLESGVETPQERAARLAWEKRNQGVAATYAKELARIARERARRAAPKPARPPFNWKINYSQAGWWHAQKPCFAFGDAYHTTQISLKPERFGITVSEIHQALQQFITQLDGSDLHYYKMKCKKKEEDSLGATDIRSLINGETIDLCYPLQKRVYDKGWLKVYAGRRGFMEGTDIRAIKAAVREYADAVGAAVDLEIFHFSPTAPRYQHPKAYRLNSRTELEKWLATV